MTTENGQTARITRIAMWSGPRNISTAMMYSFASRPDCTVWDEPFYAFYLSNAGISHPMNDEVIAAGNPDWAHVVDRCLTGPDTAEPVFYQKHMTHHMLPGFDRSWIAGLSNAFLIRSPERVLASYARKRSQVELRDIGFVEQAELFDRVADSSGTAPAVVDTDDILTDPRGILMALCNRLGIGFDESMLSWRAGPKPYDGAWAPHWYNAVWQSTGFQQPPSEPAELPGPLQELAEAARPYYERLKRHKITN